MKYGCHYYLQSLLMFPSVVKKVTLKRGIKDKFSGTGVNSLQETEDVPVSGEYQCIGNFEQDYMELCVARGMLEIPKVVPRIRDVTPMSEKTLSDGTESTVENTERNLILLHEKYSYLKPRIQVEMENDDNKSVHSIYIRGWKIDEKMMDIFSKCLPASQTLHTLNFWNVGLTDHTVDLLINILPRCPNLKTLVLDGNPLPQHTYYKFFCEDSTLDHITLRNNKIDDDSVWLITQALQEPQLLNKHLVTLNLSYNHISNQGASYFAEVLRMNRSLLSLSLAHNEIGDEGALYLAEILGYFALTPQEVVERRYRLLGKESLEQHRSSYSTRFSEGKIEQPQHHFQFFSISNGTEKTEKPERPEKLEKSQMAKSTKGAPKKKEKEQPKKELANQIIAGVQGGTVKKEDPKLKKPAASSEQKPNRKERKSAAKDKSAGAAEPDLQGATEAVHPLLAPIEYRHGQVFLLGNRNLINLNLSMNKITERGLKGFAVALESQSEALKNPRATYGGTGLLRLSLGRNNFSLDNPNFQKIQEIMLSQDPILKGQPTTFETPDGNSSPKHETPS
uniref:Leucine-rich repeat-containing protein 71-like isoform X2 n=1 Tax=Geotrypetes seraphini TaxID=260995 RepID=A0A6P8PXJ0_GEOSA|nr:leucine-rich repeat-containing protein 71-like isoform X2 [Geotrypetes seraphini]